VLFPGAPLPLHIFEPRYREMLADCMSGSREFGLVCREGNLPEREIAAGTIGCVAYVESVEPLPDGRSNILVTGRERFALDHFVESPSPYHVADVTPVQDDVESEIVLDPLARRVRSLFDRVGRAARQIADDAAPLPELPEDPARTSFAMAQYIDLDLAVKQQLLSSRSPSARLRQLEQLLGNVVETIEARSRVHSRARTNGRGAHEAGP
jgi:Lon protease-like protein